MLIVRWCQNYFTQYDCFCRNKITCFFFYLRIFRFHIFCCVHDFGLPYCDFFFFFTVLHLSTFTFSLWSFIAAFFVNCFQWCCCLIVWMWMFMWMCVCVCVLCFKNAFNVLDLRISLQYLSSIYVKHVHVCVQRHPKFAKSIYH